MPKLNNFDDASEQLGISSFTMRRWARQGLIQTLKLGRRRLVPQEEIDRIAREGLRTDHDMAGASDTKLQGL